MCEKNMQSSSSFSYNQSSLATGSAASAAESRKRTKYAELSSGNYAFVPVAIETLGAWGPCALEFCADLGERIVRYTGDARVTAFLKQRLDMHAIQRGNVAAVVGTLAEGCAL